MTYKEMGLCNIAFCNSQTGNGQKAKEYYEQALKKDKNEWGISFADSTFVGKDNYSLWILIQYCMDIKKMTYKQVLTDTTKEENLRQEMMNWHDKNYN